MTVPKKKPRHIWRPFEEARNYVHSLGLQSVDERIALAKSSKRPSDVPADVRGVYRQFLDWLGRLVRNWPRCQSKQNIPLDRRSARICAQPWAEKRY